MTSTVRETFGSRFGLLLTMIGVAVGLGNVWRFPYMVGKFGGASFVLLYVLLTVLLGVPALMAEWSLGRATRRGPVGAFARAGLPGGKAVGWLFFLGVSATGYYTVALGWVLYYALGEAARLLGASWAEGAILPPATGYDPRAFGLELVFTAILVVGCALVLARGLRAGIERASRLIMPALYLCLLLLIVRSVTLPGAGEGIAWYLLKFEPSAVTPAVLMAALGQACFTLSLGGTFMVVYGSYLGERVPLARNAAATAGGDLLAGILAGFAILPAVFALGLEPASGPALIFETLPGVFARIPFGALFGLVFYLGLLGAAFLSAMGAFEVLIAGLTDNTKLSRRQAVWATSALVYLLAIPAMINLRIFTVWDLTFGSGMQTVGALLAVITVGWCLKRATLLAQIESDLSPFWIRALVIWLRWVVPGVMGAMGAWWVVGLLG